MAWIESHQTLGDHPKTYKLARTLGTSRPAAVGHLHYLWWWALEHAEDGDLSGAGEEVIADVALWDGDPNHFVAALQEAKFLTLEMQLNDWHDYAGRLIDKRKQDAERKRNARARAVRGMSAGHPRDGARNRTVPNRTVPNQELIEVQSTHTAGKSNENGATEPPADDQTAGKPAARVRYTAAFEKFWTLYPKGHGDKKPAFNAWKALTAEDQAAAIAGLAKWLESDRWERGIILDAQRFLSRRRWESDPPPPRSEPPRAPDEAMQAWLRVVAEIEYRAEHGEWRQGIKLAPAAVEAAKAIGGRNNIDPTNEFQRRDFLAAYRAAMAPEESTV